MLMQATESYRFCGGPGGTARALMLLCASLTTVELVQARARPGLLLSSFYGHHAMPGMVANVQTGFDASMATALRSIHTHGSTGSARGLSSR